MVFTSSYPPAEIPAVDLPTYVFTRARTQSVYGKDPSLTAIVDSSNGEELSFSQIEQLSNQFASGLVNNLGLKKRDVVAVFSPNNVSYSIMLNCKIHSALVLELAFTLY